ncbi:glycosyltransferase [Anditalea andensis]|uniref:Glycosyltransferase n=1 Tax=Anditalea andensis TaxID=1048983 RepID=A0A074L0F6_9BACT|nr:glycosyltransferase [Anditalea andensis]KEO74609.1 hypothetical protein EL17_02740 [Anditalea andensis]
MSDSPIKLIRIVPLLDFGGLEQRVHLTAKSLKNNRMIDLGIIALGQGGAKERSLRSEGVLVQVMNHSIRIPNLVLIFRLIKIFKKTKPHIIHTSGAEANFHGLVAAKISGIPLRIGEEIGFPNHSFFWACLFKLVYLNANKVLAISESVKQRLIALGEVKANKVEVIYNPLDMGCMFAKNTISVVSSNLDSRIYQVFNRKNMRDFSRIGTQVNQGKTFVFIITCRLVPIKNLKTLINVFGEICKDKRDFLQLWLVGDGPQRGLLELLVKDLGLVSQVIFFGFIQDVKPYLTAADAFVLPSFSEGFSNSLVEAMQCGLPCIVTNQGGPGEIIIDCESGYLIDPYQPGQLKDAMVKLIEMDGSMRKKIGQIAQISIRKYSLQNHMVRLMEIYNIPSPKIPMNTPLL